MPFIVQQHISRGAATPCVARTVLQTQELLGIFRLSKEEKDELMDISHAVMLKLVACLDAAEPVLEAIERGTAELHGKGLQVQAGGRVIELPSVLDLRTRAETFLSHAKQALREIMRLFKVFHGQSFGHKFQKIIAWAEGALDKDDPFLATLRSDAPWIAELVEMRNSVEHPASSSGTFVIEDFRLAPGPVGTRTVAPPTWQRVPTDIRSVDKDLRTFQDNLLTFFEDVLADGLKRRGAGGMPIDIMAIPETDRDAKIPIRLRVVLLTPPPAAR